MVRHWLQIRMEGLEPLSRGVVGGVKQQTGLVWVCQERVWSLRLAAQKELTPGEVLEPQTAAE